MCDNGTCSPPNSSLNPCFFYGIRRNQNPASYVVPITTLVVVAILSPVAVAGNTLVLAAIWKNPSLRTPSLIILCGLAFTDLCTGLITEPWYIVQIICSREEEDNNKLSFLVYILSDSCGKYFCLLTSLLITLVSIERWLHMSRRSSLTVRRSCFIVATASLLMIPLTVFSSVLIISVTLIICVITTSILYFKIFRIIRRHQQQVQANEFSQNSAQPAIDTLKYKKSVFSILYILVIFYVSFLPVIVILGFDLYSNELSMGYIVAAIFIFLSSSLNPLIYIWRMNDIRNGVKHLLKKLICKT